MVWMYQHSFPDSFCSEYEQKNHQIGVFLPTPPPPHALSPHPVLAILNHLFCSGVGERGLRCGFPVLRKRGDGFACVRKGWGAIPSPSPHPKSTRVS